MADAVERIPALKQREAIPRPVPRLSRLTVDRALSSHDQIAAILGTEILRGVHRPGDNMPPEPDLDFHLAIAIASGNPLLRSMASVIEAALAAPFSHSSPIDDASDHELTVNSHAAIVDAVEARDEQAAAAAMLKVIDIGVRRI